MLFLSARLAGKRSESPQMEEEAEEEEEGEGATGVDAEVGLSLAEFPFNLDKI